MNRKHDARELARVMGGADSRSAERSLSTPRRGRASSPTPALNRISVETLNERVYIELRNAIMEARIRPGEGVSLRGLARALGTSAQPIRDAVKRLISEKALEAMPNRTVRVPPLTDERFRDLSRLRVLLEGEAASCAAGSISLEGIRRLEQLTASMETALTKRDLAAVFRCNREFHFTLYREAGSEILLSMIENLWLLAGPYLSLPVLRDHRNDALYQEITFAHHGALISALRGRKPEAARKAIASDISSTAELLLGMNMLPRASTRRPPRTALI